MIGIVLLLAIGLAVYAAFLVVSTSLTLQYPPRRTYAWAVSRQLPGDPGELSPALNFRRFEFQSRGRRLIAWDIVGNDPDGPLIVLTHGWSDSKVGALSRIQALATMSSRLIAWDLPGHGESAGACELGLREPEDLLNLINSLEASIATRVVLFGWSLGAGVSLVAAEKARVAGVIAEAPYRLVETPAARVMQLRGSPWKLNLPIAVRLVGLRARRSPSAGFDRAEVARAVHCPVLVLHGTDDAVCPIEDARAIAGAASHSILVEVSGARHNDMWTNPKHAKLATDATRKFLEVLPQTAGVGRSS
ncbi:MAG: alpha/beta hydrolase [Phycisphaerales bacterium]